MPGRSRRGDHRVEVGPGPELGADRVVPARRGSDRPRRTDIAGLGADGVVAPLAVRDANRMDRRQVDDVEAEPRQLREDLGDPAEPSPRAREQLVPRTEARQLAVDVDGEHRRHDLAVAVTRLGGQPLCNRRDRPAEQNGPFRQLTGEVLLPCLRLAPELVLPGRNTIRPGGNSKLPPPCTVDGERAAPPVAAEIRERHLVPAGFPRRAHAQRAAERVVAVLEDGRIDVDLIAHGALDGIAAAIEGGLDGLDLDAWLWALRKWHGVRFSVVGSS